MENLRLGTHCVQLSGRVQVFVDALPLQNFALLLLLVPLLVLQVQLERASVLAVHVAFAQFLLLLQEVHVMLHLCASRQSDLVHFGFELAERLFKADFAFVDFSSQVLWLASTPQALDHGLSVHFEDVREDWQEVVLSKLQLDRFHRVLRRHDERDC